MDQNAVRLFLFFLAGWALLAAVFAFAAPAMAAQSLEVKITNPRVWPKGLLSGANCEVDYVIANHTGKPISGLLFSAEVYDSAGSKIGAFWVNYDNYLSDGEASIKYTGLVGRDVAACETITNWKISKLDRCRVPGTGEVDPQSCYRLLKATSGSMAAAPLPSFPAEEPKATGGKANPSKPGGEASNPRRMPGETVSATVIPTGNYICFSSMGGKWGSWVRMGNVEIVSNNMFRIGDSRKYGYSYDAATGKIAWSDGMHKGDDSSFHYTKEGKPEIAINKSYWPRPTWYCKQE